MKSIIKLFHVVFIVCFLFSCKKTTITSKESTVALPLGKLDISPDFFVKNFLSNDALNLHYILDKGDSLAVMDIGTSFNVSKAFETLSMGGIAGQTINLGPLGSLLSNLGNVVETFNISGFSRLGSNSTVTFNEPIRIIIPIYNGFNKTLTIDTDFRYLDKNDNTVPGVSGSKNVNILPNTENHSLEVDITGYSHKVEKIEVKFSFSFHSGNPTSATIQKNGLPLFIDSVRIEIPLDLKITNFDVDTTISSQKNNNPFSSSEKYVDITSLYLESYLAENSPEMPIHGLGLELNFLDGDNNSMLSKNIDIFPKNGNRDSLYIDNKDIEKVKTAKYITFAPSSISHEVSARIIKKTSSVKMKIKFTGKIDREI